MAWIQQFVDGGEAGLIGAGWLNTDTGEFSANPPPMPSGISTYTIDNPGAAFEGQGGTSMGFKINGTPYDQFRTEYSGTGPNGRAAGITTGPNGISGKSYFVQTPSGPLILPESIAKAIDPNAIPYEQTADGGYGGFGGFLDQAIVPALMAGVGAAGVTGLGGGAAGFGSAGVPDAVSTFGGGSFGEGAGVLGNSGGGGMWDWLDSIYGPGPSSLDPLAEIAGGYGNAPAGTFSYDPLSEIAGGYGQNAYDFAGEYGGGYGNSPYGSYNGPDFASEIGGGYGTSPAGNFGRGSIFDVISKYGTNGLNALKSFLGGGGGSGNGGSTGGSIFDQITGNPLQAAFNMTPFLLALSEANRQGGDINSSIGKLNGLYDSIDPNAVSASLTNPYDAETARGRTALMTSLGNRGVLGSSFGNADVTNFDTTRDLGRSDLLTKAKLGTVGVQGDLQNSILGAITKRNTNRNMLLGSGLNASGRLFQPNDPFNSPWLKMLGAAV